MGEAQHNESDSAEPSHLLVGRQGSDEPGRHTHQDDGGDQGSSAPDSVTDVTEDDGAERANKERDGIGRKGCEDSTDRAEWLKEQRGGKQRREPRVDVLVIGLESCSHKRGNCYLARLLRRNGGMGRGCHGHLPGLGYYLD